MERCPIIEYREERERHHQHVGHHTDCIPNVLVAIPDRLKHGEIEMTECPHIERHDRNPESA